jgi:hypothetical protein
MIRSNQHRHNLDTRAHEALQPRHAKPVREFDDCLRRREEDTRHAKAESEPGTEAVALAQPWTLPPRAAAGVDEPPPPAGLETPTPASAATAQAHLRLSLPLAPQSEAWTFDLSTAGLPVQTVTLARAGNGQLNLSIQSSGTLTGQQMESHLPRLKQRLADKVSHVAIEAGLRAPGDEIEGVEDSEAGDDGSAGR